MSKQKYTVLIYPTAEHDLYDIKEYFEQILKTSPDSLFGKFSESIDRLEDNPLIYPLVKDPYYNGPFRQDNFLGSYQWNPSPC